MNCHYKNVNNRNCASINFVMPWIPLISRFYSGTRALYIDPILNNNKYHF